MYEKWKIKQQRQVPATRGSGWQTPRFALCESAHGHRLGHNSPGHIVSSLQREHPFSPRHAMRIKGLVLIKKKKH